MVSNYFKQLLPKLAEKLLKAKTNVNVQYFLAKNLQINIIRNSFEP